MAYTPVPTKNVGDSWTETDNNIYIRDNFAAGVPDIFTTKGDLAVASGADAAGRLGVGSNNQVLIADSAQALGMRWGTDPSASVVSAKGDLVVGTAADTVSALAVGANGAALVADSTQATGVKWLSPGYARAIAAANQTIPNAVDTLIQFDTVQYDSLSAITTGAGWKYTVPTGGGGHYFVFASIYVQPSTSWNVNETIQVRLYKNGSYNILMKAHYMQGTTSQYYQVIGNTLVFLNAADYIDVRVYQGSGTNITVEASTRSAFGIARIL